MAVSAVNKLLLYSVGLHCAGCVNIRIDWLTWF